MIKKLGKVISNSGPVIGLAKLDLLNILWEVFDEAYVTTAVYEEIVVQGSEMPGSSKLKYAVDKEYIKVYSVIDELLVNRFYGKLHRGELETIAAGKELKAEYILIDDKAARSLASALFLEPSGLLGILKIAKIIGKIQSLKECLDRLLADGYYISNRLYNELLRDVGEVE